MAFLSILDSCNFDFGKGFDVEEEGCPSDCDAVVSNDCCPDSVFFLDVTHASA